MEHITTIIDDLQTMVDCGAGVFDKPSVDVSSLGTTPEEAGTICTKITTSSGIIEELANNLRSLQGSFAGEQWQGAYSDSFINDLGLLASGLDSLKESATSMSNWITNASSGYSGIDTYYA